MFADAVAGKPFSVPGSGEEGQVIDDAPQSRDEAGEPDTVQAWLRTLLPANGSGRLGASGLRVFNQILGHPGDASYATATEMAETAQTSISSVTRLAQRLGYDGWPDLQRNLRVRHLARLSLMDVADAHGGSPTPFQASVRQDADSLTASLRSLSEQQVMRIATRLAAAESIYAVAQGSFAAVAHALLHNIRLAGYPARALLDNAASIANHVSRFTPTDLLIVCSYWRLYDVDVIAAAEAHAHGATVIVIADNISPALEASADDVLLVPAEGRSFFPSLTAAMAVQQGLVATLASLDPERTRKSMVVAEDAWQQFKILHRSVTRTKQA
jgi:DNA-binding MurR/RpiR family transcriptional regulator